MSLEKILHEAAQSGLEVSFRSGVRRGMTIVEVSAKSGGRTLSGATALLELNLVHSDFKVMAVEVEDLVRTVQNALVRKDRLAPDRSTT